MMNLWTPYNSHLPIYIFVSKRSSKIRVVHIHNNLLELHRNIEVTCDQRNLSLALSVFPILAVVFVCIFYY